MAGQNTLIIATDYNSIQNNISNVLGVGGTNPTNLLPDESFGYGQSVASAQVSLNAKVSLTQWNNLRTDIIRARQYQTGVDQSGITVLPTLTTKITEADRAAYALAAASAVTSRLVTPLPGQVTRENLVPNQSHTGAWNAVLSQTVTVNFSNRDAARNYFNTGSRFEFSAVISGFSGTNPLDKDNTWYTMLTNMGTIYYTRTGTTCTGSGNTSGIGFSSLSGGNQLVFSKDTTNSTYSPNRFALYARISGGQLVFTLQWEDLYAPGGFQIDEVVTGTITSTIQVFRASGTNVSQPLPSASTTGF
jgi:hypothetical protein